MQDELDYDLDGDGEVTPDEEEIISEVDKLIFELSDRNFYTKDSREDMLKIFHLLLRERDPEQKKKVRRLFRALSNFMSEYGEMEGITEDTLWTDYKSLYEG